MSSYLRCLAFCLLVGSFLVVDSCDSKKNDPQVQPGPTTAALDGQISPAGAITTVTATDASGKTTTATPSSTGTYSIPNLALGTYTLTFTPAIGYTAPASSSATLVAGGTTVPTVTVAPMVTTATLSGQVNPAGSVITVTATNASGVTVTATPSATGIYAFTNLPFGTYTLTFTPTTGYTAPASGSATLVAGGTTVPTVTLAAVVTTATLSGQANPAGSVTTVTATNANGVTVTATPSATGAYAFANLPFGAYTLTFTPAVGYAAPAPTSVVLVTGGTTVPTVSLALASRSAFFSVDGVPIPVVNSFSLTVPGIRFMRFSGQVMPGSSVGPTVNITVGAEVPVAGTYELNSSEYNASYTPSGNLTYYSDRTTSRRPNSGTVTITVNPTLRRYSGTYTFTGRDVTSSSPSGNIPPGTPPTVNITGSFDNYAY